MPTTMRSPSCSPARPPLRSPPTCLPATIVPFVLPSVNEEKLIVDALDREVFARDVSNGLASVACYSRVFKFLPAQHRLRQECLFGVVRTLEGGSVRQEGKRER